MNRLLPGLLLLAVLCLAAGCSRPPAPPPPAERSDTHIRPSPKDDAPPVFQVNSPNGPGPWTNLAFYNDPRNFQFAVVTDRTGGHREGVFEDAVTKLNLLRPEFVMSVGDLIEGYTKDPAVINAQWDEFDGFVQKLAMPFFYVAGNHDYTNPAMAKIWAERRGPPYYFFVYRDVLFLCLNSLDGGRLHAISAQQVDWAKQVLADHPDVRWTLVFLHTPLWEEEAYDPADRNWAPIEQALQGRKFTVFAGHWHHYVKHVRQDARFLTLATTGGGSGLRGPAFGEFDQVAWVTMTDDGPVVANLWLKGIWDEDIVTAQWRERMRRLEDAGVVMEPLYADGPKVRKVSPRLRLTNDFDFPLEFALAIQPEDGVKATGELALTRTVAPNSVDFVEVALDAAGKAPANRKLATVAWSTKIPHGGQVSEMADTIAVGTVRPFMLPPVGKAKVVDGKLDDWDSLPYTVEQPAQIIGKAGDWSGPEDARFRFGVARDATTLFIAVEVTDGEIVSQAGYAPWKQDGIEIRLDGRPGAARQAAKGIEGKDYLLFAASPNDDPTTPWLLGDDTTLPPGTKFACVRTKTGYITELGVPLAGLLKDAGDDSIRLNIAVDDKDGDAQTQLWWMPNWAGKENLPESGTFKLK